MGRFLSAHPLTVHVPDALYHRLERRAARTHRSVEDEVLDLVIAGAATADETNRDVAEISAALALLDDDALWQVARSHLSEEEITRLEQLHFKRQREGLTAEEDATATMLAPRYERCVFTRAQAAALLMSRGYDISSLPRRA